MEDDGLKSSMRCLELALQNGAFDEYFYQKMNEMHQENIMNETEEKLSIKYQKIKRNRDVYRTNK